MRNLDVECIKYKEYIILDYIKRTKKPLRKGVERNSDV